MKYIYLILALFVFSFTAHTQSLGYTDLGVLFSQENFNGTARYNAMGGAFGALGGDISSIYQNPAGGAVFTRSEISGSLSLENTNTDATYYNSTLLNNAMSFRVPQVGFVMVFDSPYANNNWSKFTFGFNYSMTNDFDNEYRIKGNNSASYVRYDLHPFDDTETPYNISEEQTFTNITEGRSDVYTFTMASAYKNFFYIGSSLNLHDINFTQHTYLSEQNSDDEGNTLFADYSQYLSEIGSGISLGIGIILKPTRNIRLGAAYQSPVWYPEIIEVSDAIDYDRNNSYNGFKEQGLLDISSTDIDGLYRNTYSNNPASLTYRYGFNSPEKWTVSAALTLGQHGLISADLYQKNYSLMRFTNSYDFTEDNEYIKNNFTKTRGIKTGAELRFNQISLRGGAYLEETPYSTELDTQYKKGISMGVGFRFKSARFDIAYQHSNYNSSYAIYNEVEPVNSADLEHKISRISTTLSFSF